ncbi:MAG: 30S ribosomal protein S2 [Armatimonadetes bacterium]|nr:30S ribosomal protein S2 [Armatimonadota bacterium]
MSRVSMKELLEAGAHFGLLTRRWNPKMRSYIYGERNGIHIIDLHQTLKGAEAACDFLHQVALNGGSVLFVGTKKQAQEAAIQAAEKCGMFHVAHRWLGGMLTNFQTIRESINRLKKLREMETSGAMDRRPKKEAAMLREEMAKKTRVLGGIEDMPGMPAALFIIDVREEHIAVTEAKRLGIPIVAIVDTNCDPEDINYVIPGNDDAIRAIKLVAIKAAEAILEALQERDNAIAEGTLRETYVDQMRRQRVPAEVLAEEAEDAEDEVEDDEEAEDEFAGFDQVEDEVAEAEVVDEVVDEVAGEVEAADDEPEAGLAEGFEAEAGEA